VVPQTNTTADRPINQKAKRSETRTFFRLLAAPAYETHGWATTRKPYSGDCAYANGFPVLVKGLDAVTLRTPAANDIMSCREEGGNSLCGWLSEV